MNKAQGTRIEKALLLVAVAICFVFAGYMGGLLVALVGAGQDLAGWEAHAEFAPYWVSVAVVGCGVLVAGWASWLAVSWAAEEMSR